MPSVLPDLPQNNAYCHYGNARGMKPKSTTIENLRSFENSGFNFEGCNVTVGPSNSGKTNLLRILKMPASGEFLNLGITQEIKLDQGKKNRW